MKGQKIAFWVSAVIFSFCAISMAGVLYAETPGMSSGGFISLSPYVDCVIWGIPMAISGLVALFCGLRGKPTLQGVSQSVRYTVAYMVNLVCLSLVVLFLGGLGLLYEFSPTHLPIYGYAAFLIIAYLVAGFLWGRFYGGSVSAALISCGILLAVLGTLAYTRLDWIARQMEYWGPNVRYGYTDWVMDSWQGQVMAWLNLPACVVMGNYSYAYYPLLGGCHTIPREVMTWMVTLCPVLLFTASWILGRKLRK